MTPQEAHAALTSCLLGTDVDVLCADPDLVERVVAAWRALDTALKGDADLPEEWARLGAKEAAHRAGRANLQRWSDLVGKGYAPQPDGHDANGRAWWHPATVDAFRRGDWQRPPASPPVRPDGFPPPRRGPGSTGAAWAQYARDNGVSVDEKDGRNAIYEACRKAGLVP